MNDWRESMRIELTFPDQSQETADLKSGTGTSSVTSPITMFKSTMKYCTLKGRINIDYTLDDMYWQLKIYLMSTQS